jgi:topoisomerase-4 subunit B
MKHITLIPDNGNNKPLPAWKEHIRLHPEMYICNIGEGSLPNDGIYRLIKEVLDDAISDFVPCSKRLIEVSINDRQVSVRDYGSSLPMDWLAEYVSERRRDGIGFEITSVDTIKHYGVGLKVVNLLSSYFIAQSIKDGKTIIAEFEQGRIIDETEEESQQQSGSLISFIPDAEIFGDFHFVPEHLEQILLSYLSFNEGLEIRFNGQRLQMK